MRKTKRMSEYVKADYDKFVTWNQKADAAHAIEQGMRAIERTPRFRIKANEAILASAIEQGMRAIERTVKKFHSELYYASLAARLDTRERCWCGLTREAHVMPERDFRPGGFPGRLPNGDRIYCEAKS